MLLNLLSKDEKHKFLDLLVRVINIDGPTSDTEKLIIEKLRYEMGEEALKYHYSNAPIEKLIDYFAQKPTATKNLVFYNIINASLADEFYSVEEHLVIERLQEAFQISAKKRTEIMKTVYAERDLREKAKRVISEWLNGKAMLLAFLFL